MAKLISMEAGVEGLKPLRKFGQNLLGITFLSDDFDAPLPEEILQDFGL
jgi:hypothetical protein